MKISYARFWRQLYIFPVTLLLLYGSLYVLDVFRGPGDKNYVSVTKWREGGFSSSMRNLGMTEKQCSAAFPGLTKDIDETVALGPFAMKNPSEIGPLVARVKDGSLYILHPERKGMLSSELLESRAASLHQIHRAVVTSSEPLPDTMFELDVHDEPYGTSWSYTRPAYAAPAANALPPITRVFLMPHFSFWGWPLPFIRSFSRAAAAIDAVEAALPFSRKDPRPVWRGTMRFHGIHNPLLREDLVRVAQDSKWADVQALDWRKKGDTAADTDWGSNATNALMIEDFCRYKYILHTEGITYSGRFQFLQMCNSIILTPPIAWMQHTTHLVRPLFSCDLELGGASAGKKTWVPSQGEKQGWPRHYNPHDANIIFVAPDWSDLEDTIRWLERNPKVAEGIARRQRQLFVEKGYLSPAAETCYWRALIRGWNKVAQVGDQGWKESEGMPWEVFAMQRQE